MRRLGLIAVVLAAAGGAACSSSHDGSTTPPPDPCALSTAGAAWLAYGTGAAGTWDVAIARADGTCARTVVRDGTASDLRPAWIGTTTLAYDSDRAPYQSVWLHAMDGGAERRLDVGALRASAPTISPDRTTVAFAATDPDVVMTSAIYVVPVAGGTPVNLTPEATVHGNGRPVFSPDGTHVYFVSNRTGAWEVYRVAAGAPSFDPEKVTTASGIIGRPAVSPDGTRLAFTRIVGATTEVVLYDLATATTTPLAVASASDPDFDPAGGRLVVRAMAGGRANLYVVALPGGATTRVTFGVGPDGVPAFAPLGH